MGQSKCTAGNGNWTKWPRFLWGKKPPNRQCRHLQKENATVLHPDQGWLKVEDNVFPKGSLHQYMCPGSDPCLQRRLYCIFQATQEKRHVKATGFVQCQFIVKYSWSEFYSSRGMCPVGPGTPSSVCVLEVSLLELLQGMLQIMQGSH